MNTHNDFKPIAGHATANKIKKLVDEFESSRPAYTSILGLFGPIFIAQERARQLVVVNPGKVTRMRLESFQLQKSALIEKSTFMIDMGNAKHLFKDICNIAIHSDAIEMRLETVLMQTLTKKDFDPGPLFLAVINDDEDLFNATAHTCQTSPQTLKLLAYNSIKPSLEACALELKGYLPEDTFWRQPGCPVCGSPPVLSVLDADANRSLICGFCWSEWKVPRIYCPSCQERDSSKLYYQYSSKEKEYRIDTCDNCRSYMKTVDSRELGRPFCAPLESIVSAHLDLHMTNYHAA